MDSSLSYDSKGRRVELENRLRQKHLSVDEWGYIRINGIEETQGQVTDNRLTIYERPGPWSREVAVPLIISIVEEIRLKQLT